MRINDGGLCNSCEYFEHDCGNGEGCFEHCLNPDQEIYDNFVNTYDDKITECKGYRIYVGGAIK